MNYLMNYMMNYLMNYLMNYCSASENIVLFRTCVGAFVGSQTHYLAVIPSSGSGVV